MHFGKEAMNRSITILAATAFLAIATPALANWGTPRGGWATAENCAEGCTATPSTEQAGPDHKSTPATTSTSDNGVPETMLLGLGGATLIILALLRRRRHAHSQAALASKHPR